MKESDIIVLISLVIAIFAIINEKNRKHLLLKFGRLDFSIFTSAFILINYFVFYEEFYNAGVYWGFLYFKNFGLAEPNHYAYIISILSFLIILFKIRYSFFPYSRKWKVLKFYKGLIENSRTMDLIDFIERYHLKTITHRIKSYKKPENDEPNIFEQFDYKPPKEKIADCVFSLRKIAFRNGKLNKFDYAKSVLHYIVNDSIFIKNSANLRPMFFAEIIETLKKDKEDEIPTDFVKQVFEELINLKNSWLIKELKESCNNDYGQPSWFFEHNKLIGSLIKDVSVSHANKIWIPFGEIAIFEIENELNFGKSTNFLHVNRNQERLWDYKSYISIKFFNILIIEAIVQNYQGSHFWMYYYNTITNKILHNLNSIILNEPERFDTNYHYLISEMNEYCIHWLNLSNDKKSNGIYIDIIKCIGNQIHSTIGNDHISESKKKDFISSLISLYCNLKENDKTNDLRLKLEEMFVKPTTMTAQTHPYYSYFHIVWREFDKIPHQLGIHPNDDLPYFVRFKQNVITPLGLEPNEN